MEKPELKKEEEGRNPASQRKRLAAGEKSAILADSRRKKDKTREGGSISGKRGDFAQRHRKNRPKRVKKRKNGNAKEEIKNHNLLETKKEEGHHSGKQTWFILRMLKKAQK